MDGNLAMANSLENTEEPADYFKRIWNFDDKTCVKLEEIYMDSIKAGSNIDILHFGHVARKILSINESGGLHKHIVSNNEGLEPREGVAVCPECKSKDVRPYRDHYCCYECGNYFRQTER